MTKPFHSYCLVTQIIDSNCCLIVVDLDNSFYYCTARTINAKDIDMAFDLCYFFVSILLRATLKNLKSKICIVDFILK